MKPVALIWIATIAFAYLVAGRTLEQMMLAAEIGITGFVLSLVAGKIFAALDNASIRTARR